MIDPAKYGPWAVIPGGSEGIGPCLAEELAKIGINSVLIARKPEPLEAAAADIERILGRPGPEEAMPTRRSAGQRSAAMIAERRTR